VAYRIMFVLTPRFHPNEGGVQMTTYKLSKWFAEAGHSVGIFSFQTDGHIDQTFAEVFTPAHRHSLPCGLDVDALQLALRQFRPNVVINQMPYEHRIGDTLRKFNPPLLLGCLRNTLFSVKNNLDGFASQVFPSKISKIFQNQVGRALLLLYHRSRHNRDLKRILATYDYFVMFAPQNIEELRFFVPDFKQTRIKLVPNSIPAVLDEVPKKDKRLLWLGRVVDHQKRADLILPLWEKVQAALPDWEFDVVGNGPASDELNRVLSTKGIKGLTLHGRKEPNDFFRRSTIYVMTSAFEGFPNTLVEAQSFGAIPVLFNSFPVAEFIVSDGVDGALVQPFDLDAMAERIIAIAKSEQRIELAANALRSARRFQIDTIGEQWLRLFDECLQLNRARRMKS